MRKLLGLLTVVALTACVPRATTAPVRDTGPRTPAQRACERQRDACENRCFAGGVSSLTGNALYDNGRYNMCAGECRSDNEKCLLDAETAAPGR